MTNRTSSTALLSELMADKRDKQLADEDRLAIPLDPEMALRALLKVDPEAARVSSRPEGQRKEAPKQEDERG